VVSNYLRQHKDSLNDLFKDVSSGWTDLPTGNYTTYIILKFTYIINALESIKEN
jgi:hypothetical protein